MAVTFVGASAVADSATPVTTIDVDRSALSLAVGDYCLVYGWAATTVDWDIPNGADGTPWTKLWKYDRFQVWGKFLHSGFGTSVTQVNFSGGHVVYGMQQAFYRGAFGLSWLGAVTGNGRNSFQAPGAFPTGVAGRAVRLFTAGSAAGVGLIMFTPPNNTRRPDGSGPGAEYLTWFLCDRAYVGSGNVGAAATIVNNGLIPNQRRFTLASALTIIFNQNRPPNAPTLSFPPPGAVLQAGVQQDFGWIHDDPDGDPQSGFTIWMRDLTISGPWVPVTVGNTSAQKFVGAPPVTLSTGHDYEWQVQTTDNHGATGARSSSRFFSVADLPDVPLIDYPANGGTVTRVDHLDWTFTDQQDWEVRRVADDIDGDPDVGTIYEDITSGDSTDASDTRTLSLTFATNGRYEHLEVRCKLAGIWSDWADVRVFVSYVEPPVADLQVFEGDDGASIELVYATPAADPGITDQPDATSVTLRYSTDGGATFTPFVQGLAVSGSYTYAEPNSGVDYVFSVQAFADNGTASETDWISRARLTVDEVL